MSVEPVAVILAAGKGSRIYPLSGTKPKPVLPVGNRPLLAHQLGLVRSCGISRVFIVIGHLGYEVVSALGDGSEFGVQITYVEQPDTIGIAHALGTLEPHIDAPFLLLLGDIYFVTDQLRPVVDEVLRGDVNANLVSKVETDPEMIKRNFAILEGEDGRVRRVIEKPRYARTQLKGCGIYMFDLHIFDAIRRTPRTAMRDEYEITDSIQILIDDGLVVGHQPVVQEDFNLTVPEDLLAINLLDLDRAGLPHRIGSGARLAEGCTVQHSVIGANVTVTHPIRISESLIFPGVRVQSSEPLDRVIVVDQSTIIPCPRRSRPA
jgi:NDP-sugar pyrophosphorylase family protein